MNELIQIIKKIPGTAKKAAKTRKIIENIADNVVYYTVV